MRKKTTAYRGSIVCTASNAGVYPFPVAPVYATSKHAVVGAVRSLARPLELEGIQINALAPAVIGMPSSPDLMPSQMTDCLCVATNLASDVALFDSMILTPMSTAVDAVEEFVTNTKLTGEIAEISGEKFTFRAPPDYVDEDSAKNLETFWRLGYA
jgi:NAD(P)-dependent dehydrogenase (short-subunit alcohol dehydrogenase family)